VTISFSTRNQDTNFNSLNLQSNYVSGLFPQNMLLCSFINPAHPVLTSPAPAAAMSRD